MKKRNYDEANVIYRLSRKAGISINKVDKSIQVLKNSSDIGNHSWGKIDYLTNYCGYHIIFVSNIENKYNKHINNNNEDSDNVNTKVNKRQKKLNMAIMSKNAMKKIKAN